MSSLTVQDPLPLTPTPPLPLLAVTVFCSNIFIDEYKDLRGHGGILVCYIEVLLRKYT
jgi:hypothetical protein